MGDYTQTTDPKVEQKLAEILAKLPTANIDGTINVLESQPVIPAPVGVMAQLGPAAGFSASQTVTPWIRLTDWCGGLKPSGRQILVYNKLLTTGSDDILLIEFSVDGTDATKLTGKDITVNPAHGAATWSTPVDLDAVQNKAEWIRYTFTKASTGTAAVYAYLAGEGVTVKR